MDEKLPEHFQRVKATGRLRIRIPVPIACRGRLPGTFQKKVELIQHLGVSDINVAKRKERELGVIDKFTRMIEAARPVPSKWAYIPPSAVEIERVRMLLEGMNQASPESLGGMVQQVYRKLGITPGVPELAGRVEEVPITQTSTGLSFNAGVDLWANERLVPDPTREDYRSCMNRLAKHVGHTDANAVTRPDLIGWKDAMVVSKLDSKTIRNYLGKVSTVFKYLAENAKIDNSPVDPPVTYTHKKDPRKTRLDFDKHDRAVIYRAAMAETRPLYKWGNLIPLFTGMRPEEFVEADTRDIQIVDGEWCLLLNYDYRTSDLKNDESIRPVPLHRAILAAEFIEYVESLPPGPLFPMLKTNRYGKRAPDASRKLGVWLRETAMIENPRKVNNSHRHSVISILCNLGVRETTAKRIAGHAISGDVHEDYIHRSVEALKAAVELIPIPV